MYFLLNNVSEALILYLIHLIRIYFSHFSESGKFQFKKTGSGEFLLGKKLRLLYNLLQNLKINIPIDFFTQKKSNDTIFILN